MADLAVSCLVFLLVQFILLGCARPFLGKLSPQLFKLCFFLFFGERRDLLGGFGKVNMASLGSVKFG